MERCRQIHLHGAVLLEGLPGSLSTLQIKIRIYLSEILRNYCELGHSNSSALSFMRQPLGAGVTVCMMYVFSKNYFSKAYC